MSVRARAPELAAAALLALALAWLVLAMPRGGGIDWYHFWGAARYTRSAEASARGLYADRAAFVAFLTADLAARGGGSAGMREAKLIAQVESGFGFVNSPAILALVRGSALDRLPFEPSLAIWRWLQVLSLAGAIVLFGRLAGFRPSTLLFVLALALVSGPLRSSLRVGQFLELTLLLAAGGLALANRRRSAGAVGLAGALLGAAVVLKPVALPLLAYATWRELSLRARRAAFSLGVAAGAGGWLLAGEVVLPGGFTEFARHLPALLTGGFDHPGNRSTVRALAALGLAEWPAQALLAVFGATLLGTLAARRRRPLLERPLLGAGLVVALALLPAGLVWYHYWIFLAPALLAAPLAAALPAFAAISFAELLVRRLPALSYPDQLGLMILLAALLWRCWRLAPAPDAAPRTS